MENVCRYAGVCEGGWECVRVGSVRAGDDVGDDACLSLHETVLLCLSGGRARSWLAQWPPSSSLPDTAPPLRLLSNAQPDNTQSTLMYRHTALPLYYNRSPLPSPPSVFVLAASSPSAPAQTHHAKDHYTTHDIQPHFIP